MIQVTPNPQFSNRQVPTRRARQTSRSQRQHDLRHRDLLALPFDAYLQTVAQLLECMGYQDLALAGRTDRKGRNRDGGYDLSATLPGGRTPQSIVIQAKQFDSGCRIYQRHVDELRGVALRAGASEALLVTTGPISPSIDQNSLSLPPAPVRILAGEELLQLLAAYGVGRQGGISSRDDLDRGNYPVSGRTSAGPKGDDSNNRAFTNQNANPKRKSILPIKTTKARAAQTGRRSGTQPIGDNEEVITITDFVVTVSVEHAPQ